MSPIKFTLYTALVAIWFLVSWIVYGNIVPLTMSASDDVILLTGWIVAFLWSLVNLLIVATLGTNLYNKFLSPTTNQ